MFFSTKGEAAKIKPTAPARHSYGWLFQSILLFITDGQKIAMYIHIDSISHHHNVRPATHPITDNTDLNTPQHISMELLDSGEAGAAKPDGVLRIESWVFIEEPKVGTDGKIVVDTAGKIVYTQPVTGDDFHHWGTDSATMNVDLEFALIDVGKGAHIRNRFANNVDHGDFGPTIRRIIPS